MTNKELYIGYHDMTNTQVLRNAYLDTLKLRASYGSGNARKYVDKIMACSK